MSGRKNKSGKLLETFPNKVYLLKLVLSEEDDNLNLFKFSKRFSKFLESYKTGKSSDSVYSTIFGRIDGIFYTNGSSLIRYIPSRNMGGWKPGIPYATEDEAFSGFVRNLKKEGFKVGVVDLESLIEKTKLS